MGSLSLETMLPQAGGGIFVLVRIAILRALELADGKPSLIKNVSTDKVTTIALREIAEGKVAYLNKKK